MNQTDFWGECVPGTKRCPVGPYLQDSAAYFGDVKIFEPCNYASNIAYYRAATRLCDNEDWFIDD